MTMVDGGELRAIVQEARKVCESEEAKAESARAITTLKGYEG